MECVSAQSCKKIPWSITLSAASETKEEDEIIADQGNVKIGDICRSGKSFRVDIRASSAVEHKGIPAGATVISALATCGHHQWRCGVVGSGIAP